MVVLQDLGVDISLVRMRLLVAEESYYTDVGKAMEAAESDPVADVLAAVLDRRVVHRQVSTAGVPRVEYVADAVAVAVVAAVVDVAAVAAVVAVPLVAQNAIFITAQRIHK